MDDLEKIAFEQLQYSNNIQLLVQQLHFVYHNSLFYQEKFESPKFEKIAGRDLAESLTALPFTTKQELLADQANYPPFGRLAVGADVAKLSRIHITSGSTGKPLYIAMTARDVEDTVAAGRRAFRCAGLTPEDMVVHCLNYCLWAGGVTDHLNLEATGATVVPFGVGNSKKLIETILQLRPTAISCTPSYLSVLELLLQKEFHLTPRDLGLKKAFLGAEGGLQNPAVRARIEETWGLQAIDANYGMAEVLSIFGAECPARQGLHFHGQGILWVELIDPTTGRVLPLAAGQEGEMVLTHLRREAQPLVRYRTGDIIKIVGTEPCTCGRHSFRFLVMGRADDMITVRGVNVYPDAVANLIGQQPQWFSGEFEIIVDAPPPIERPLLRVELAAADLGEGSQELAEYLLAQCRTRLNFTPRLEFLAFGRFPRSEGKTRRLKRTY